MELIEKQGFKKSEIGLIPTEWKIDKFKNVTNAITCGVAATPTYVSESIGKPFLSASHVQNGKVTPHKIKYITKDLFNQITKHNKPERGDILYTRVGAGIGEAGVIDFDLDFAIYVSLTLIKPKPILYNYYLKSILNSDYYKFLAKNGQFAGGGVQNLNVEVVREFPIPIPPLEEQKAIATALSDVDDLISNLDKLITKKKAIKQGAMQQLLTPPNKGGKRLPGFSGEWAEKTVDELSKTFTKQTGFDYSNHIKPTLLDKIQRNTYPFIQNKDFDGHNVNFDTDYYIPSDVAERFPRILLNERCLLISISGSIGKVGVFNNKQTAFIGGAVAVGKFIDKDLLDWVMLYLKSEAGQNLMLKDVKAGSHQNLILDDIRKMKIPMPSKKEQAAICEMLNDIQSDIELLQTKKAKYQSIKQGMMQELLTGKTRLV